jgi:hypothetical protein
MVAPADAGRCRRRLCPPRIASAHPSGRRRAGRRPRLRQGPCRLGQAPHTAAPTTRGRGAAGTCCCCLARLLFKRHGVTLTPSPREQWASHVEGLHPRPHRRAASRVDSRVRDSAALPAAAAPGRVPPVGGLRFRRLSQGTQGLQATDRRHHGGRDGARPGPRCWLATAGPASTSDERAENERTAPGHACTEAVRTPFHTRRSGGAPSGVTPACASKPSRPRVRERAAPAVGAKGDTARTLGPVTYFDA